MSSEKKDWSRRHFLQTAGSLAAVSGVDLKAPATLLNPGISLVLDPGDPIAGSLPSRWAADELEQSLASRGIKVLRCSRLSQANPTGLCIVAAGATSPIATPILNSAKINIAASPEALALCHGTIGTRKVLLTTGHDSQGLVYALLDLADRTQNSADPIAALTAAPSLAEHPANQVRSITRLFVSDVQDKPWYNDHEMWRRYLTLLATQRFNRFNLAFGIGYDFIRRVTDAYFLFAYPFLMSVPGYNVRVPQLPDAERDRNLEMLRFISEQTAARGMEFYLGIWMHGYIWIDSPDANYTIEGLTKETHAAYCRDAVRQLLKACPAISGITLRTHGESGVDEGSYDFWKTVFSGIATCGRKVAIDLHPKGLDQNMLDNALATHQPITASPKFWAEHLGMTYHQADIRETERPKAGDENKTGLMKLSTGTRSFLRYGYGDLLREDRDWSVVHRIWPGTQRLLLWGDPITAAGYSRCFSFCGSNGVEICEPLSFKGRRGSGIAGSRTAYADAALVPHWDWEKYTYTYRVWGRLLYNPDTGPDTWRRATRNQFGNAAEPLETALANVSRILPIITTAHDPSAANNSYWPEIYFNQSIIDDKHPVPYTDTPSPKVFGNTSPLDPQLFSRMNDFAAQLLSGERDGKYTPIEVAQWIEDYAAQALKSLQQAEAAATKKDSPAYRRLVADVTIQAGLGQFFAAKFRSGVLFGIYEKTNDRAALEASLTQYRKARDIFAALAATGKAVYLTDITVGEEPQLRGDWLNRLPAIDKDIAAVAQKLEATPASSSQPKTSAAIQEALARPKRTIPAVAHTPPATFHAGQPLELTISLPQNAIALLYYRHVDQADRFVTIPMELRGERHTATIPAAYTDSQYPLQYYFAIKESPTQVTLYPGFSKTLTNQPYFVVRRA